MSAEPTPITNTEFWSQWEGKVVNGVFPLRRFLGGSDRSAVFLSEQKEENRPDVAIKFLPAESVEAEAQLVQWVTTSTLFHEHLVSVFDVGRYRVDGREFLYVVMEYADQTLAEILPRRPLVAEEVRELLLPTLGALAFLHRKQLVHGRLKPSNFLAVGDVLKLSSDSIRAVSHTGSGLVRASAYDPPELKDRGMNAAGDVWGLGMTLMEALTQRTTAWPDETVELPPDFPAQFANTVARCLSPSPGIRPTVLDIEAQFKPAPAAPAIPAPKPQPAPVAQPTVDQTPPPPPKPAAPKRPRKPIPWARIVTIGLPILLVAWGITQLFDDGPTPSPAPAPAPVPAPAAPVIEAKPAEPEAPKPATKAAKPQPPATKADASSSVVHESIPDIPRSIRNRIRGRVHVTVRALVDADGNVVGTMLEKPGPSKYFARIAEQSTKEWKFVPGTKDGRVWLVLFVFTRDGAKARPIAQ